MLNPHMWWQSKPLSSWPLSSWPVNEVTPNFKTKVKTNRKPVICCILVGMWILYTELEQSCSKSCCHISFIADGCREADWKEATSQQVKQGRNSTWACLVLMYLELISERGPSILWTEWGDLLKSQSTVVPMHYKFVFVETITMSVEFSYIIRRNVITFNPESKWASAAAIPIHVCAAYQGEEGYNGFYVPKQSTVCNWKCHFLWSNFICWWLDIFHLKLNSSWPCCILGFGLMSNFSQICASSSSVLHLPFLLLPTLQIDGKKRAWLKLLFAKPSGFL